MKKDGGDWAVFNLAMGVLIVWAIALYLIKMISNG